MTKKQLGQKRRSARYLQTFKGSKRHRESVLLKRYGMTVVDYALLLTAQGGVCAICRSSQSRKHGTRLHVDHNHSTGRVRGLLCFNCNVALGMLKEDPLRVSSLQDYLLKHEFS